jgi:hypothetical protein
MTDWRKHHKTADMSEEELASLLTMGIEEEPRHRAAEAELRLREHRAILRQADAAERAADATVRYTKYTRWLAVLAVVAAIASALAAAASWYQVLNSDRTSAAAVPHRPLSATE